MPQASLNQVESLDDDQVGRDQGKVIGADKGHGGAMMLIRPIGEGTLARCVDENELREPINGDDGSRRGPDAGSR